MTTTIAIVGSRHWTDYAAFKAQMCYDDEIRALMEVVDRIVSGAAHGVDEMAAKFAKEIRADLTEYAPDKSRPFTQAAHERNQRIVDDLDASRRNGYEVALIAMPGPKSKGTLDTIRRAKRAGIRVIVKEVPE